MDDVQHLQSDFRFIRDSVTRSGSRGPAGIYFLWSVLVLCGFVLADVRLPWVGVYWAIAGPLGGALSGYLGWRAQRRSGHIDRVIGIQYAWHWGAMMCAIFLTPLMVDRGVVSAEALGPIILLILALSYVHAGVHLDPALRWIGLLTAAGYVAVLTVTTYAWSMVGVTLAVALTFTGIREARRRIVDVQAV